ncbi:MAG: formylmethanofuran dehydrogenase subunit A [Phycisphaerales bacterium]|nr:formylmethanofuran dehydrogenase subunit A [Phycisphaerales bacterium]
MSALRIANGRVYDPANGIDGEIRDVCIQDRRIVASLPADAPRLDVAGMIVMPGGIDIHAHIAGPKVNLARKLQPEDRRRDPIAGDGLLRAGSGGVVPTTFATGYRYAAMGYTTVMEAAAPPIAARHVLEELHDTPIIDAGFYIVLGNNLFLFDLLRQQRYEEFRHAIAWWLNATKAYGAKLVNVGSDELWKGGRNANITDVNQVIEPYGITPLQVTRAFIDAIDTLGLPHAPHVHCNNLGHSGNYTTTLDTMKAAEGRRMHMAHIQFHSYGGKPGGNPTSAAREIIDYVNTHPNITCDVGQVMFGKATFMTADAPLAWMVRNIAGNKGWVKWVNADTECESGCGIMPFAYQEHVYVHTMQWATGLELFLLSQDPWRVMLSTDHPNGGSFTSYPRLIALLMDRNVRREAMKQVNQRALAKTVLPDLDREYTLNEIAIITRAAPARALGLHDKGHLGPGADADLTIYTEQQDVEAMFNLPRHVIKDGVFVIEDYEMRRTLEGRLLHVEPEVDPGIAATIKPFFEDNYSIRFENYAVADGYLHRHESVPMVGPDR